MKMAYLHVIYNQRHSSSILLISVLYLLCYAEENSREVKTCIGEYAVLPCVVDGSIIDANVTVVAWTRRGLDPHYVYFQRNGNEEQKMKNRSYNNRTSLFREELTKGNVSLKISSVNASDEGTYECVIQGQKECTVLLTVWNRVNASVGEYAVLPCEVDSIIDANVTVVAWTRRGLDPHYVYFQRNGNEERKMKNLSYYNRTSLFREELTKGNVSLKISSVKASDKGTYKCVIHCPSCSQEEHACTVELIVGNDIPELHEAWNSTAAPPGKDMVVSIGIIIIIIISLIIVFIMVYKRQSILELNSRFCRPENPTGDEQSSVL